MAPSVFARIQQRAAESSAPLLDQQLVREFEHHPLITMFIDPSQPWTDEYRSIDLRRVVTAPHLNDKDGGGPTFEHRSWRDGIAALHGDGWLDHHLEYFRSHAPGRTFDAPGSRRELTVASYGGMLRVDQAPRVFAAVALLASETDIPQLHAIKVTEVPMHMTGLMAAVEVLGSTPGSFAVAMTQENANKLKQAGGGDLPDGVRGVLWVPDGKGWLAHAATATHVQRLPAPVPLWKRAPWYQWPRIATERGSPISDALLQVLRQQMEYARQDSGTVHRIGDHSADTAASSDDAFVPR